MSEKRIENLASDVYWMVWQHLDAQPDIYDGMEAGKIAHECAQTAREWLQAASDVDEVQP